MLSIAVMMLSIADAINLNLQYLWMADAFSKHSRVMDELGRAYLSEASE